MLEFSFFMIFFINIICDMCIDMNLISVNVVKWFELEEIMICYLIWL